MLATATASRIELSHCHGSAAPDLRACTRTFCSMPQPRNALLFIARPYRVSRHRAGSAPVSGNARQTVGCGVNEPQTPILTPKSDISDFGHSKVPNSGKPEFGGE